MAKTHTFAYKLVHIVDFCAILNYLQQLTLYKLTDILHHNNSNMVKLCAIIYGELQLKVLSICKDSPTLCERLTVLT